MFNLSIQEYGRENTSKKNVVGILRYKLHKLKPLSEVTEASVRVFNIEIIILDCLIYKAW